MFSWFKRSALPETSKTNPGKGIKVSIAFTNGERTLEEELDIVSCFTGVLKAGGYPHKMNKSWVELDTGFIIQPRFASMKPLEKGGVNTITTVEVSHPKDIPAGVFEFQHSTGDDSQQSITKGFEAWMQLDLPVFLDAIRKDPQFCTLLQLNAPASETAPERKRRVVLGSVSHLVSQPVDSNEEEHPFCPCCLFTQSEPAMKRIIAADHFYGIRFFAMRDTDGTPKADCRLNGEDWEAGKAALIEYIKTWPDRGFEFRKQFVVVQNQPVS